MNTFPLVFCVLGCLVCLVSSEIAQVKYLGGITFLLKDRCPEYASDFEISIYKQCAESEILHVSKILTGMAIDIRLDLIVVMVVLLNYINTIKMVLFRPSARQTGS